MEDETTKEEEQPSASKKENSKVESTQDLYDRRKYEDRRDDQASNSESFTSGSYSGRSRIDMADVRPEVTKPQVQKRAKAPDKKKKGRKPARVEKRRKSPVRRRVLKRIVKRKPRREQNLSVSTIFTRLSSPSGARTPGCKFCGHRCCRRRFEYEARKTWRRNKRRRIRKGRRKTERNRILLTTNRGTKQVQAGSRCLMLSPLLIRTNAPPKPAQSTCSYCEITPEMIYDTLKKLTMWRQNAPESSIRDHMKRYYPVNRNDGELQAELSEKLRVAALVGIVMSMGQELWCLSCELQKNRTLSKTHVTKFWQVYADTMTPIRKRVDPKDELQ